MLSHAGRPRPPLSPPPRRPSTVAARATSPAQSVTPAADAVVPADAATTPRRRRRASGAGRRRRATCADPPPHPPFDAYRVYNITISVDADPGKDDTVTVTPTLAAAASRKLATRTALPPAAVTIVRKSFDARPRRQGGVGSNEAATFTYVVDVDAAAAAGARPPLADVAGRVERVAVTPPPQPVLPPPGAAAPASTPSHNHRTVAIIGGGPAGLFAALALASAGATPIILERGQPVSSRGRDIGALFHRRLLHPDSNLCYGEGGAGTWSDGKLTTRIGKNSDDVRRVLATLVAAGAPPSILAAGKPHLGTDRLVRMLASLRESLDRAGGKVLFGARVERVVIEGGAATGVTLTDGTHIPADAVVLASGHSARDTYASLAEAGVCLSPKPTAVGFRVEHPQTLIDAARYGALANRVCRGAGAVPVADYRLATHVSCEGKRAAVAAGTEAGTAAGATNTPRDIFSFCMCPGGQVVPTSVDERELCVNGMSFSKRASKWANAALVVGVGPADWADLTPTAGPLAGVEYQRRVERAAAIAGGGGLVAPVQRVVDFLNGTTLPAGATLPPSSYRLGVQSADLTTLYSPAVITALRAALLRFERDVPGFASSPEGLLHGVETRTSSPVRVDRDADTLQSTSTARLFPAGEGAGYAGGIVSACVDGLNAARAVCVELGVAATV